MMKKFLHVGCGSKTKHNLKGFDSDDWGEVRLDIDPHVTPDIVGTLTDLSAIDDRSFDGIYSSHNIEHLYPHEVPIALKEFYRVLKDDGLLVITCPDLESVCRAVAENGLLEPVYNSPAGPISPIDILYGHRGFIAQGNHYMAHKCGFTFSSMKLNLTQAGFTQVYGGTRPRVFDLWALAFKNPLDESLLKRASTEFLP